MSISVKQRRMLASMVAVGLMCWGIFFAPESAATEGAVYMSENAATKSAERKTSDSEGVPTFQNRLIHEKSPYLLQHANNPVDWYPWGEEAFRKAAGEDKPIFLSIGYSTCHWCHVMEHETFEDEEAARLMNEVFVSIKVDREERPDIDQLYMTVAQLMTGGGGWPLSVIMTPDRKVFFTATYLPKESRHGRIGMMDLSRRIKELWTSRRDEVLQSANKVMGALTQIPDDSPGQGPDAAVLEEAYTQLASRFDETHGGFSQAPKFPTPHNMLFLLRYWKRTGREKALQMVEKTLQAMRLGGIYDHVGFGFHRYSTDSRWVLPHFEKMLYDQAMLAMAYIEAYQAVGREEYRETAEEIFEYILRDMTAPHGGFYSAEDADSEGEEGKFYVWTAEEIRQILPPDEAELIIEVFTVLPDGNFQEEATGHQTGTNILHIRRPLGYIAKSMGISESELNERIETARNKLFAVREERIHPHKDDKVLTDWNGLMIAALSKGAQAFQKPEYAAAAGKAADFILSNLYQYGRLLHRYRDGEAAIPAHVDDYAFFVWGLLELYEATFDVRRLQEALALNETMLELFWDNGAGGLYFTAHDQKELPVRKKEIYDGATPSGNSVAALNLLRLARITGKMDMEQKAEAIGKTFSGNIRQFPSAFTQFLSALEFAVGPSYEVVIAGNRSSQDTKEMIRILRKPYIPNKVVVLRPTDELEPDILKIADYARLQGSVNGSTTAYVCRGFQCDFPTNDPLKMLELLGEKKP